MTNKPRAYSNEDVLKNVWTKEEARQFLTYVKSEKMRKVSSAVRIGSRQRNAKGDFLGLRWKDLDGAKLRVERQLGVLSDKDVEILGQDPDASRVHTQLPKGKRARTVEILGRTLVLLHEHKRQQAEDKLKNRLHYTDHGLMFAQGWEHKSNRHAGLGMPLNKLVIRRQLDRLCEAAGVKRITVHGLRHTCATLLLSEAVPPHIVQRRLGHSKATMTMDIYAQCRAAVAAGGCGESACERS